MAASNEKKHSESPGKAQFHQEIVHFMPRLKSFAYHLAGDKTIADDLLQNSMERALNRSHHYTSGTRLDSWLYRIIYTQWMDRLRNKKRRSSLLGQLRDVGKSQEDQNRESGKKEGIRLDIRRALAQLSQEHRVVITLITIAGFSYEEAAEILALPIGTVASRVARARNEMADFLTQPATRRKHSPPIMKVVP